MNERACIREFFTVYRTYNIIYGPITRKVLINRNERNTSTTGPIDIFISRHEITKLQLPPTREPTKFDVNICRKIQAAGWSFRFDRIYSPAVSGINHLANRCATEILKCARGILTNYGGRFYAEILTNA